MTRSVAHFLCDKLAARNSSFDTMNVYALHSVRGSMVDTLGGRFNRSPFSLVCLMNMLRGLQHGL